MVDLTSAADRKTVFIIGAGASKEVGLPVGSELKKMVAEALDIRFEDFGKRISGDRGIFEALQEIASRASNSHAISQTLQSLQQAGWRIRVIMLFKITIQ